jgi:hypothetical protein
MTTVPVRRHNVSIAVVERVMIIILRNTDALSISPSENTGRVTAGHRTATSSSPELLVPLLLAWLLAIISPFYAVRRGTGRQASLSC